jgi:hypothetical protein
VNPVRDFFQRFFRSNEAVRPVGGIIRRPEDTLQFLSHGECYARSARMHWLGMVIFVLKVASAATIGIAYVETGRLTIWAQLALVFAVSWWIKREGYAGKLKLPTTFVIVGAIGFLIAHSFEPGTLRVIMFVVAVSAIVARLLEHVSTLLILTNKRILKVHGIIGEQRATMPFRALTDTSFDHPFISEFLSKLLGPRFEFGHLIVESAGQNQALSALRFVRDPQRFYDELMALAYGTDEPPGMRCRETFYEADEQEKRRLEAQLRNLEGE